MAWGMAAYLRRKKWRGGGSYEGKSLTNIGFNYSYALKNKNWHLEIGINYLVYKYTASTFLPPGPRRSWEETKNLISLPVRFRYEAGKYIFFNGNLYLDIDVSESYGRGLSGIGSGIGLGGQYYFNNNLGVYVNPQFDVRNIASFSGSVYKFAAANVFFGLAYRLK
ncbi:MAG: hypothetical protein ACQUHE_07785 [Bacteroidia bacterium]